MNKLEVVQELIPTFQLSVWCTATHVNIFLMIYKNNFIVIFCDWKYLELNEGSSFLIMFRN